MGELLYSFFMYLYTIFMCNLFKSCVPGGSRKRLTKPGYHNFNVLRSKKVKVMLWKVHYLRVQIFL